MNHSFFTLLFISVLLFVACIPPQSKESYLAQYEHFISQVRDNRNNPGFKWDQKDKEFEKFSQVYYQRFANKLSFSEKVLCKKYEFEYNLMRIQSETNMLKDVFHDDLKKMQERMDNYIENDLPQDFEFFKKEVNETVKVLKKALKTARANGSSTPSCKGVQEE
jgi:hypothetical protein